MHLQPTISLSLHLQSFLELLEMKVETAHVVLAAPLEMLQLFNEALEESQRSLLAAHPRRSAMCFKPFLSVRIGRLPHDPNFKKMTIPRANEMGRFVEVQGTVVRAGLMKSLEWERMVECSSCKLQFLTHADLEQRNVFPKLWGCPRQNPSCNGRTFNVIEGSAKCIDYQEIKIQEQIGKIGVGNIPRSLIVVLTRDLVDMPKAGDDIVVSGVLRSRWKTPHEEQRCDLEVVLEANSLFINNQQRYGVNVTEEIVNDFKYYLNKYHNTIPFLV
jgi:DNA replicative helicase MCM subunit Mcm2 (Cdc46/Mcm family)